MPIDLSVLVPIILVVLGGNVLCLLVLLVKPLRGPARRALVGRHLILVRPFRACLAEALGTFALVFVACLATLHGTDRIGAAFAQGSIVAVMISALGRQSGGHYNPAITLGVVAAGRLHPLLGAAYWLAQLGGAIGAAGLFAGLGWADVLAAATPAVRTAGAASTTVTVPAAIMLEAVATFFLVLVVFGSALDERAPRVIHPLAVGLTVAVGVLSIGAFTGGALNPARYLGPALVAQRWTGGMVYVAGPCLGGSLAAVLMQFFFLDSPATEFAQEFGLQAPTDSEERQAA
jgi:glycerol uptake facilitator-like aquaporin